MRQVENLLRGTVTLTARGPFPERLLNLCAQEQVPCWGLEWVDEHALRLLDHEGGICFSFVVHLIGEHEIEEFFINVHVDVPSHKKYDASRSMHRIKF